MIDFPGLWAALQKARLTLIVLEKFAHVFLQYWFLHEHT